MTRVRGISRRGYVDVPWGQVHYRTAGDDSAPVLLIVHQSPLSSATYDIALAPLAIRGLRVVAVDTPGFGMSDPPPRPWSIPEYAAGLWQTADALGLDRVHLLGQHTGAVVAAEATLRDPGRVHRLLLQGLPLYDAAERQEKKTSYAPGYRPDRDGSHLRVIWDRVYGLYPRLTPPEADRQVAEYLLTGPDYATAYRAVFAHELDTAALNATGVPLVLLHGDEDLVHRFTPVVRAALPQAPLVTIPGGTDFVSDEQPEAFADAVAAQVHGTEVTR
ncbi:alpha/beta fold hydrolase [Micromonospora endophytica]|uniref:Alpha/beta hydrolase n=1 Tax=Micromonospora endophytica TaxID=515350 RepID=A0A2W2D5E7_9ACTN|nr:alpha/beta hydrolase [Micromonospora endophytica]PZF98888.1 alpha/beta hydrolase [Micromonospora endophytica]RIW44375.1 alpha/beta hydrolase [Micromonospora endophytica]BCJ62426.1 alpha/beta hydrolase [Micromonospora endophytica]